jgi:uncharacterized damage-inducible protein DinB
MTARAQADSLVGALERAHAGSPWHGPSRAEVLKGITAKQAAWRPAADAHSIWELVLHMRSWTEEVLRRAKGGVPDAPENGDWPTMPAVSAAAWRDCVTSLDSAHEALIALVRTLDDSQLAERVKHRPGDALGTAIRVRGMIRSLGEHDIYHTGQVATLKRLARGAP